MEAPATLENCDVFMFPFCLAQREFCFLLLTVASPVYQGSLLKTWKSCWLPLLCLHSCVLCTRRQCILLLWYTLFYILYYYSLSLWPVFGAITGSLNGREFKVIITGFLVREKRHLKVGVWRGWSFQPSSLLTVPWASPEIPFMSSAVNQQLDYCNF